MGNFDLLFNCIDILGGEEKKRRKRKKIRTAFISSSKLITYFVVGSTSYKERKETETLSEIE